VRKPDYDRWKILRKSNQIKICNYPYIIEELRSLIIRSEHKITCPKNSFKDVADAMMNVIYILAEKEIETTVPPVPKAYTF